MAEPEAIPIMVPKDALNFFRAKGLQIGFSWLDVQREEHDKAFTVAKAMTRELLEDIRAAMDAAIAEGQTLAMFVKNLRPALQARGWWGRQAMTDPATGETVDAQLGSPNRLRVIYRTNMRTSYAAGRWARIQRNKKAFPLLRYVSVMDGRERPEHHAWHNTVLPVDDPWWETHYPPCDWGCRCRAVPLNQRMLDRKKLSVTDKPAHFGTRQVLNKRTGEIRTIEKGIGAGWDYNPGRSALEGITPEPLPPDFGDTAAAAYPRSAFDRAFGLNEANRFQAVWVDKGGWPMAVTQRMKEGEGQTRVGLMIRTLTDPDEIRWAWVRDEAGEAILMRRYVRGQTMVDVGRLGWRIGKARAGGKVVWQREDGIAAGYNPRQPRHGKGGPKGGQFRKTGRSEMIASLTGDRGPVKAVPTGSFPDSAAVLAKKQAGVEIGGKRMLVDHGYASKILNRHGEDKHPVTIRDIFGAHRLVGRADSFEPGGKRGRHGDPRFAAKISGKRFDTFVVGEARARNVLLVSIYKVEKGSPRKRR